MWPLGPLGDQKLKPLLMKPGTATMMMDRPPHSAPELHKLLVQPRVSASVVSGLGGLAEGRVGDWVIPAETV